MNTAEPRPELSSRKKLAFSVAATAIVLGGLEVACRVAGYGQAVLSEREPGLGWRFVPSQDARTANGRTVHINALGLRDDECPAAKPAGETRVLVVGDSVTYGVDVGQDEPFPRRLAEALTARGRTGVRTLNAGVPGYDLQQYLLWIERYGLALSPDLILIGLYQNDIQIAPRPTPYVDFPGRALLRRTAMYEALDGFVNRTFLSAGDTEDAENDEFVRLLDAYVGLDSIDPDLPEWQRKVRLAREILERLADLGEEHDVKIAVLMLPAFADTKEPGTVKLFEKLGQTLDKRSIKHHVVLTPLADRHPDVWLAHDPGHFSPLGHTIVADEAAKWLLEADLLP